MKKLTRSKTNRWLAGVCGGLAEYWEADPTLVRFLYVVIAVLTGILPMLLIYLVGWIIIPTK